MPRGPRKQCESDIYHILVRGVGQSIIFEDSRDRRRFIEALVEAFANDGVDLYCWCLMDNHVHLMVHAPIDVVSASMQTVLSSYATYFNIRHEGVGHLFQSRFKSEPIDSDEYLLTAVRYIHWNPVKAGLSRSCSYPWSSFNEYVGSAAKSICDTGPVLSYFENAEGFMRFHQTEPERECLDICKPSSRMTDDEIREFVMREYGIRTLADLASMDRPKRNPLLHDLKDNGASVRQLQRLTGIGRSIIQRA